MMFFSTATRTTFQFTPLREGRHAERLAGEPAGNISIHAPTRGATHQADVSCMSLPYGFQFTPLREGRRKAERADIPPSGKFQFTPLREGRLKIGDIA